MVGENIKIEIGFVLRKKEGERVPKCIHSYIKEIFI